MSVFLFQKNKFDPHRTIQQLTLDFHQTNRPKRKEFDEEFLAERFDLRTKKNPNRKIDSTRQISIQTATNSMRIKIEFV